MMAAALRGLMSTLRINHLPPNPLFDTYPVIPEYFCGFPAESIVSVAGFGANYRMVANNLRQTGSFFVNFKKMNGNSP